MPNWCDNQVTITGPNKIIDRIEKITKEEDSKDKTKDKMLESFSHLCNLPGSWAPFEGLYSDMFGKSQTFS